MSLALTGEVPTKDSPTKIEQYFNISLFFTAEDTTIS